MICFYSIASKCGKNRNKDKLYWNISLTWNSGLCYPPFPLFNSFLVGSSLVPSAPQAIWLPTERSSVNVVMGKGSWNVTKNVMSRSLELSLYIRVDNPLTQNVWTHFKRNYSAKIKQTAQYQCRFDLSVDRSPEEIVVSLASNRFGNNNVLFLNA